MQNTNTKTCEIENCEKPSRTRGWCDKHYQRWLAHGDPLKARKYYTSTDASFAANTSWRGDCLIWTGLQASNGYGRMVVKGRQVQAHRFGSLPAPPTDKEIKSGKDEIVDVEVIA